MSSRPPESMTATAFRIFSSAAGAGAAASSLQNGIADGTAKITTSFDPAVTTYTIPASMGGSPIAISTDMLLCIKLPEELGQYRKNDQPVAFKTALRQFTHEELLDLLVDAAFGKS